MMTGTPVLLLEKGNKMIAYIKRLLRKFGTIAFEDMKNYKSQELQVLLKLYYRNLINSGKANLPTFDDVGFRCYSQFEEDGILLYIFSLIGTTNKIAVEICAGDGIVCNSTNLIVNHGWLGYLFDGNRKKVRRGRRFFKRHNDTWLWPPKFTHAWITAENVNDVISAAGVSGEIDLLSIDVDGMDYWIWKAIDCIKPRVVLCETHNIMGPDDSLTAPYSPDFTITVPGYHSASLKAMTSLAESKGYRLVGTHRYGFNAFYIRNGIGENLFPPADIAKCLQHPNAVHSRKYVWPKVSHLKWHRVD